jgi:hypothetical protein
MRKRRERETHVEPPSCSPPILVALLIPEPMQPFKPSAYLAHNQSRGEWIGRREERGALELREKRERTGSEGALGELPESLVTEQGGRHRCGRLWRRSDFEDWL